MSRSLLGSVLEKYPAEYFIETGSYTGGGIGAALKMGYNNVISIEYDSVLYNACVRIYGKLDNVTLVNGDSATELEKVLENINNKALIFLDAHFMDHNPILQELDAIKNCKYKQHIIMIDDRREFAKGVWSTITVDLLLEKIRDINSDYEICFEDSANAKGDIITAWIPLVD